MKSWASDGAHHHASPGVRSVLGQPRGTESWSQQGSPTQSLSAWDLRASRFGCGDNCRRSPLSLQYEHFVSIVGAEAPAIRSMTPSGALYPSQLICLSTDKVKSLCRTSGTRGTNFRNSCGQIRARSGAREERGRGSGSISQSLVACEQKGESLSVGMWRV
jgi:hypothetical protein